MVLLAIIAWLTKYFRGNIIISLFSGNHSGMPFNRFLLLYGEYPAQYNDVYASTEPFSSLFVAPFAVTPLWMGLFTWLIQSIVFLYITNTLLTNRTTTAYFHLLVLCTWIIDCAFYVAIQYRLLPLSFFLSYVLKKERISGLLFFILLGTFVKLACTVS